MWLKETSCDVGSQKSGTVTVRVVRSWDRAWRGGGSPARRDALSDRVGLRAAVPEGFSG